MNLYLAGPMRGWPDDNAAAFDAAAKELRAAGHVVFNPVEYTRDHPGLPLRELLAADLDWLCKKAQGIALLGGWMTSRGAKAEVRVGAALDIEHRMYQDWL